MAEITLILGGARSGKTARALSLAKPPRAYVATAQPRDEEMADRIRAHQAERGDDWDLIEAPLDLANALGAAAGRALVVDCLTLWLSNVMAEEFDPAEETLRLLAAAADRVEFVAAGLPLRLK
ncbi:MAG: bifunctional adenosylcobinamide kinase/adenosylcobinamide-phosphate guanylyltransferase [Pseudomonadota bacterium]